MAVARTERASMTALDGTELVPLEAPSPRFGAAMICDAARGLLVLFGGRDSTFTDLQDTWLFRQANDDELDDPTSTSPSRR